ncbi:Lysophosphatidylcholine acyltransferase [Neolecta irregularis DAH-3]|uniref:Tafazzin family protein n=1 Tax=Neolecta irregularis (strain DAH-3) TaxID=1198029 RepID=A0A1U7LVP1_NEOID|nr:Lysophosphatidylcholine acyltransferase [Neolecta irregularis DAH-3]|eukprot:OLL26612.1 Lysophosphatidylcholine acyltransferase [Neolecta irregularis DAH-3]
MRYFKWGVSRLILETTAITGRQPIVIPFFFTGMDKVMHEARKWPRFVPRIRKDVRIRFGNPIPGTLIEPFVKRWGEICDDEKHNTRNVFENAFPDVLRNGERVRELRNEMSSILRNAVLGVRQEMGLPKEDPSAGLPDTWRHADKGGKTPGVVYEKERPL